MTVCAPWDRRFLPNKTQVLEGVSSAFSGSLVHVIASVPASFDNAPYFIAFVASSWMARPNIIAVLASIQAGVPATCVISPSRVDFY